MRQEGQRGRLGGRQHSLVTPTPAQGSEAFAWV